MGLSRFFKKAGKLATKGVKLGAAPFTSSFGLGGLGGGAGAGPGDSGASAALRESAAAALSNQSQSLGEIPKAYDKARSAAGLGRTEAIQSAQDAGTQQDARAAQSLANRGLSNTTILDNARQGISAGVSRQVSAIDAQHAEIMAQLGLGEQRAKQGIRDNISQIHSNLGQGLASTLDRQQALKAQWEMSQNPDAWLESLLNIGGTAIGYGIGGPAGGAAANRLVNSQGIF